MLETLKNIFWILLYLDGIVILGYVLLSLTVAIITRIPDNWW